MGDSKMKRRGLGRGRGKGYYNIAPMDSYVHSMSALGIKVLPLERVPYGKKSTPKKSREYKIQLYSSPVGTIKEWKDFAKKQGVKKIHVNEKDGSDFYVDIDAKKLSKKRIKELEEAREYDEKEEKRIAYLDWKEEFDKARGLDAKKKKRKLTPEDKYMLERSYRDLAIEQDYFSDMDAKGKLNKKTRERYLGSLSYQYGNRARKLSVKLFNKPMHELNTEQEFDLLFEKLRKTGEL